MAWYVVLYDGCSTTLQATLRPFEQARTITQTVVLFVLNDSTRALLIPVAFSSFFQTASTSET